MSVLRVKTDNPQFVSTLNQYTGDIRRSLVRLEDITKNADTLPADLLDDLRRAVFASQDAIARAMQLATPKVKQ